MSHELNHHQLVNSEHILFLYLIFTLTQQNTLFSFSCILNLCFLESCNVNVSGSIGRNSQHKKVQTFFVEYVRGIFFLFQKIINLTQHSGLYTEVKGFKNLLCVTVVK